MGLILEMLCAVTNFARVGHNLSMYHMCVHIALIKGMALPDLGVGSPIQKEMFL